MPLRSHPCEFVERRGKRGIVDYRRKYYSPPTSWRQAGARSQNAVLPPGGLACAPANAVCYPDKRGLERRRSRGLVRPTVAGIGDVVLEDVGIADGVKVGVALGLLGREAFLVIVAQQLVEEVNGLVGYEALVLRRDKAVPGLFLEAAEDVVVLGVELNFVLVEVLKELVGAKNLGNLDKLVGVALTVEEGLLAEDHGRKHGTETPHVKAVVVLLEVDKQFGPFKVTGCDSDVVFGSRVVELGQAPVDET